MRERVGTEENTAWKKDATKVRRKGLASGRPWPAARWLASGEGAAAMPAVRLRGWRLSAERLDGRRYVGTVRIAPRGRGGSFRRSARRQPWRERSRGTFFSFDGLHAVARCPPGWTSPAT